jgi:hypothetical protein
MILIYTPSRVAKITSMSHKTQLSVCVFLTHKGLCVPCLMSLPCLNLQYFPLLFEPNPLLLAMEALPIVSPATFLIMLISKPKLEEI